MQCWTLNYLLGGGRVTIPEEAGDKLQGSYFDPGDIIVLESIESSHPLAPTIADHSG